MKTYTIKMLRTYTTEVNVQANSMEEAEVMLNRMKVDGTLYQLELEQSNTDESIELHKPYDDKPEVGDKAHRISDATGKPMSEGYCFGSGEYYCEDLGEAESYAESIGYDSLDEAYEDGAYEYTGWEDDEYAYEWNGEKWIEIEG